MRPLLAACLLALAAPAHAVDSAAVAAKLQEFVDSLDSLRQEQNTKAGIVAEKLGDGSSAHFDPKRGKVILNTQLLEANETALKLCSVPESKHVWTLAVQLLPVVAHELRHAYVHQRLGFVPSNHEDEVCGFTNSMALYDEVKRKWPDAYTCSTPYSTADWKIYTLHWKPSADGVDGLTAFLEKSSFYSKMCSIRKTEDIEACRKAASKNLVEAKKLAGDPAAARAELEDAEARWAFWGDDSKLSAARKYFETVEFVRTKKIHAVHAAASTP